MEANNENNSPLKVYYKQNEEQPKNTAPLPVATRTLHTSLVDYFNRLRSSFERISGAWQYKFEKITWGIGRKITLITALKICILSIIMFWICLPNIVSPDKMANFAHNTNDKEKTHESKHKKGYVTSVAMSGVANDLAPASPEELREAQVREYIERFSDVAVGEMDKFGIPASISMAQAIIESRSGTSTLAVKNQNHFGIKCFSKSCPKGHCSNFNDDHHKDFFRQYKGAWESWREHSQFLMKYRYRNLKKHGKNYRAWAQGLREYGYATDQTYDKKLIAVIERYQLSRLDDL